MYLSTKTYEGELSTAFRQWRADSHCRFVHGYGLSVKFTFACTHLDDRNWVVDFGGLKAIKEWLKEQFDHTLCVAEDDPQRLIFEHLHDIGVAQVRILPKIGCEAFAAYIAEYTYNLIRKMSQNRCWVYMVEVRENNANSAIYFPEGK